MQMQLKVVTGGNEGKLISINRDKFLIGRSDECHIRPKSESISRRHCAFVRKDGHILLVDLKSRNGTYVNDHKLDPAKAKVLKNGDHIRVGKLEFIAVIEAGVSNLKKPEVKSVKEAAARTAQTAADDSRMEEVDVSSWLEEADQFERAPSGQDTRQFQMNVNQEASPDSTLMEVKAEEETKTDHNKTKGKPGKLPPVPKGPLSGNSKDAASETLRKFFSGR